VRSHLLSCKHKLHHYSSRSQISWPLHQKDNFKSVMLASLKKWNAEICIPFLHPLGLKNLLVVSCIHPHSIFSRINIHLPYLVVKICNDWNDNPNILKHRYGRESFIAVNSLNLLKPFCVKLSLIDPFAFNRLSISDFIYYIHLAELEPIIAYLYVIGSSLSNIILCLKNLIESWLWILSTMTVPRNALKKQANALVM
jgi:hypothetical protein